MGSKKTSAAWQHFIVEDDGKTGRCIHCNRTVVIANGSTGNMFRHIKIRHPSLTVEKRNKFSRISNEMNVKIPMEGKGHTNEAVSNKVVKVPHTNPADISNISTSPVVINSTILPSASVNVSHQPVSYFLIQPFDENKQQLLDKQLLKIIVKNLIPFNIVEKEFIRLVSMLNPTYVLPSQKTLSNFLVSMFESPANKIKFALRNIEALALTTESWVSANNDHFIAFTVHYLNKDLELKSHFLQCISSLQKCNHIDITVLIQELASNWGLHNKILAVVTDGSEEVMKAVLSCNLNHVPCFAHILNQIVDAGLAKIHSFTLKIRNVVQYFNRNSMALSKFHEIQKEMGLADSNLITDVPSKWDTTFNMFTTFSKNKIPLLSSIVKLQLNFLNLSLTDFHFLESTIKVLVIFNSIKIAMSSENMSLSKVLHMIHFMAQHLQSVLGETKLPSDIISMGCALKDGLKQFEALEMNELVSQAVLLDPRFKKRGFPNGNNFKEACIALRHNVVTAREKFTKLETEQPISPEPQQNKMEVESEYLIDMWSEFESKDPSPVQSHTAAASAEVEAFLNDLYLPVEENPLSYWSNISNQSKFPALFKLATHVLCIPATSVPCQQLYTDEGHAFCKKRKYLPSLKVDKILFLHHNL